MELIIQTLLSAQKTERNVATIALRRISEIIESEYPDRYPEFKRLLDCIMGTVYAQDKNIHELSLAFWELPKKSGGF